MDELDKAYQQLLEEKFIDDLELTNAKFERFKRLGGCTMFESVIEKYGEVEMKI